MNSENSNEHLSRLEYAARFDAAKTHAVTLRAAVIDTFWSRLARNAWHSIRHNVPASATHPSQQTSPCRR